MPGLSAVATAPEVDAGGLLESMLRRMVHYPWLAALSHADDGNRAAVGAVAHQSRTGAALATSADGLVTVAFDGEFFDETGAAGADRFLSGWLQRGTEFLATLNGEFAAVVWDASRRELHVVTDRFGLRCLYVAQPPAAFVAASEIKAVLAVPGVDASWSEQGVAEFFSFGHFFGDNTLLRGVRAVPAATLGTYRLNERSYTETKYWTLQPGVVQGSPDELVAGLEDRFAAAVARRARPDEKLGLSLSGGLDARTILGVMPAGVDLQAVSLGIDGSLDHRSAAQLARIAPVPHHPYILDAGFLSAYEQHLRRMVHLTDGHYLDQGIVMPSMTVYRDLGIEYLMRGHGGELLHMTKAYAYSLDHAALRATEAGLETWLLEHLTGYMLAGVPDDLFTIDLRACAETSLRQALEKCPPTARPVDRVWHLFLNQRIHRETSLSMHKFGCFATIRQPYLDAGVVETLFSLPPERKLGDAIQTAILKHRRPAFLAVTNANTGARMGAGRLETGLASLRLKVGAKLGLKGYQPYERLGLWLRRELRGFVETTLRSDRLLGSGLINADTVSRVVGEHIQHRANHTFLLMSLLVFALGGELRGGATDHEAGVRTLVG